MDSGLLWTVVGTVTGVVAAGLTAWQVHLQLVEHQLSGQLRSQPERERPLVADGLSVALPTGRLPAEIRGRDALLAELSLSLRPRRAPPWARPRLGSGSWLASAGSPSPLRHWQPRRPPGQRAGGCGVNASDAASLTGGMLEVLAQLGAPESVLRPVREGTATAADRAWEHLNSGHRAGRKWLLVPAPAPRPTLAAGQARSGRSASS
jgi:hypothetical protein